jgi:hypothetical protein
MLRNTTHQGLNVEYNEQEGEKPKMCSSPGFKLTHQIWR